MTKIPKSFANAPLQKTRTSNQKKKTERKNTVIAVRDEDLE